MVKYRKITIKDKFYRTKRKFEYCTDIKFEDDILTFKFYDSEVEEGVIDAIILLDPTAREVVIE